MSQSGKLTDLLSHEIQLRQRSRIAALPVLEDASRTIHCSAQWRGPSAKSVDDGRFQGIGCGDQLSMSVFAACSAEDGYLLPCVQDGRVAYGSHDVFFGKVKTVRIAGQIEPLIYVDGIYKGLAG